MYKVGPVQLNLGLLSETSDGKESTCNAGDLDLIPGLGRSPEKGMATHSSTLAWEIPRTEKPGRLRPRSHKESDMTEQLSYTNTNTHTHSKQCAQSLSPV